MTADDGGHPDGSSTSADDVSTVVDPASDASVDDPFGTSAIRAATLAAWTTSPTRFREDANLEEDHGHGYYRDRVVIELAQNAADAAAAAGVPGRLLLRLGHDDGGPVLLAANSGAPLAHRGVLALASMRASAKGSAAPSDVAGPVTAGPVTAGPVTAGPVTAPSDIAGPVTAEPVTAPSDVAGPVTAGPVTAEPLTAEPVTAPVGRFGVGFAAVRAVSDDVVILSRAAPDARPRGVRFSARLVHDVLDDVRSRAVHGETSAVHSAASTITDAFTHALDRPSADLPILRLPFPADVPPVDPPSTGPPPLDTLPPGYDTVVVVRLRGPQERDRAARQLADVDDALLLALPALAEVRVEVEGAEARVVADVAERWRVVTRRGHHHPSDLADRPHEERTRTGWSVTWAAPRDPSSRRRHVVHAPTPTDEPCSLPGLLVATFPLDPSRRHVQPGAATRALVAVVGAVYADLVAELAAAGEDPLAWVPIGLPAGVLDAEIHAVALEELRRRPLLRVVLPPGGDGEEPDADTSAPALINAREAQVIAGPVGHDPRCLTTLASGLAGLVTAPTGSDALARVRALGVVVRDLADVVETLPTGRPIARWREVYDALARHAGEPGVADALAALPVPLVDGRTVRGPRGTLLLPAERTLGRPKPPFEPSNSAFGESLGAFGAFGLRVVHPDAAHPLLVRLGAVEASAATLLAHPAVRAGVAAVAEDLTSPDETADVVEATLALVGAALDDGAAHAAVLAEHPWLARAPLPDVEGLLVPAHDLALPGGWADGVLDALHPAEPGLVDTYGADVLRAVGVRDGLFVVRVTDVVAELPLDEPAPGTPEATLDGWTEYLAHLADLLGPGTYVGEASAVADLDAVADDAWPAVFAHLAEEPTARAALLTPVRVGGREAPSYTAWWLRDLLDAPFAAPGSLIPFLPPAPALLGGPDAAARLDPEVLAAVGAVTDVVTLDAEGWARFIDALPDVGRPVPLGAALAVWRGLAAAALAGVPLTPPDRVPALCRPTSDDADSAPLVVVVPAEDAAVASGPAWGQLADVVPAPAGAAAALAAALDVALLDGDVVIDGDPRPAPTPPAVVALLPAVPRTWWEHDGLTVDGHDVDWWVTPDREVHAATTAGLARALALAAGRWELHAAVELVLADPQRAAELVVDAAWLPSTPHV